MDLLAIGQHGGQVQPFQVSSVRAPTRRSDCFVDPATVRQFHNAGLVHSPRDMDHDFPSRGRMGSPPSF
jgi:hypothetical protein